MREHLAQRQRPELGRLGEMPLERIREVELAGGA